MQLLLFEEPKNNQTANKKLQLYVATGIQLLSIQEVSDILDLTLSQVRNAIYLYRIDALLIGGYYRIPWFSVLEYIQNKEEITDQFFAYKRYVDNHEIKGVLDYHISLLAGQDKAEAVAILKAKNQYISDKIIEDIDNFEFEEKSEELNEKDIIDWYNLYRLELPIKISLSILSDVLRISLKSLQEDFMLNDSFKELEWLEIYDLLVAREVINLPVNYRTEMNSNNQEEIIEDFIQLELF